MDSSKVIQLLSSKSIRSDFMSLLIEIIRTKENLKHSAKASFYFRKGMEHQKIRIKELECEFESIRKRINSSSLPNLEKELSEQKANLNRWKSKSEIHICDTIAINAIQTRVNSIECLMELKQDHSHIQTLQYYLESEDNLLELFF